MVTAGTTYSTAEEVGASEAASSSQAIPPPGASASSIGSKDSSVPGSSEVESFIVTDEMKERINNICKNLNVTGMSIAAFKGENLFYKQSYGYADKALQIPANDQTKYRIASISKTITGIMAMKLISEGKFCLNTRVSDYLGVNLDNPRYPNDKITVKQLLTHTSGIMDSYAYETATNTPMPLNKLLSYGGIHADYRPGTMYLYSNLGAGLMSGVIEQATGKRFYDYAKESLFTPLNMDAGFLRTEIKDTQSLAQIYLNNHLTVNVKQWMRVESLYDNIPVGQMYMLGQSDLIISASDLAEFAMALAGDGTVKGIRILQKPSVDEMNKVQFTDGKMTRGLALHITGNLVKGRTLHGHLGQAYGMISGMYFDPTDKTGVMFITNGCTQKKTARGNFAISEALVNAVYSEFFDKTSAIYTTRADKNGVLYTVQSKSSEDSASQQTKSGCSGMSAATN